MATDTPLPVPHDDPAAVHTLADPGEYLMGCGQQGPELASTDDPAALTCAACVTAHRRQH